MLQSSRLNTRLSRWLAKAMRIRNMGGGMQRVCTGHVTGYVARGSTNPNSWVEKLFLWGHGLLAAMLWCQPRTGVVAKSALCNAVCNSFGHGPCYIHSNLARTLHICIYEYMYVCYVHIRTYIYMYGFIHLYIHSIYSYMCIRVYVHMHTLCANVCIYIYVYTYIAYITIMYSMYILLL